MVYIAHYGVGHLNGGNSGRYKWGSGARPMQSAGGVLKLKDKANKLGDKKGNLNSKSNRILSARADAKQKGNEKKIEKLTKKYEKNEEKIKRIDEQLNKYIDSLKVSGYKIKASDKYRWDPTSRNYKAMVKEQRKEYDKKKNKNINLLDSGIEFMNQSLRETQNLSIKLNMDNINLMNNIMDFTTNQAIQNSNQVANMTMNTMFGQKRRR